MKFIKLTYAHINAGKSEQGGWNKKQVELLGGLMGIRDWQKDVIGTFITQEDYDAFLSFKNSHPTNDKQFESRKSWKRKHISLKKKNIY